MTFKKNPISVTRRGNSGRISLCTITSCKQQLNILSQWTPHINFTITNEHFVDKGFSVIVINITRRTESGESYFILMKCATLSEVIYRLTSKIWPIVALNKTLNKNVTAFINASRFCAFMHIGVLFKIPFYLSSVWFFFKPWCLSNKNCSFNFSKEKYRLKFTCFEAIIEMM